MDGDVCVRSEFKSFEKEARDELMARIAACRERMRLDSEK